jgi:AraC family transcriptional regulator
LEEKRNIQLILDTIDSRITEVMTLKGLAKESGYSAYHFNRIFTKATGITVMAYITRRKLQYALHDLGCGEKILDTALKYGFETHAGFTKAFKKYFGSTPSIYRIHSIIGRPTRMEINELRNIVSGGEIVHPEIVEMQPITIAGFSNRYKLPDVKFTHDIPVYWETIKMNYWDPLTGLHNRFSKSRHCEYAVCFDINPETNEFSYLLGVGVDNTEDRAKIEKDMFKMELPGGLYAGFTTPLIEEAKYSKAIRDIWKLAMESWLPFSEYEFDEKRYDFEYYDERDHFYHDKGLQQMDIFIPIQKRKK